MADLGVGEDLLEKIIGALQIGALLDQDPSHSIYPDPGLDDGKDGLVLGTVGYHYHSIGPKLGQKRVKLGGELIVRGQSQLYVPGQRGDLGGFARGNQLI